MMTSSSAGDFLAATIISRPAAADDHDRHRHDMTIAIMTVAITSITEARQLSMLRNP
jgi:hypothetical protein